MWSVSKFWGLLYYCGGIDVGSIPSRNTAKWPVIKQFDIVFFVSKMILSDKKYILKKNEKNW